MKKGFSLVEMLIVVAIILIVAAIAIPNLLRSRIAANESAAVATMRVLNSAEVTYAVTYNSGFSGGLNVLGPPSGGAQANINAADLVDATLAGMGPQGSNTGFVKGGYSFSYTTTGAFPAVSAYALRGDPQLRGLSGQHSYFSNDPLLIRNNPSTTATSADNPL
jgi:type IV pilus assembly protein PilA